jgi:hypothetical protein
MSLYMDLVCELRRETHKILIFSFRKCGKPSFSDLKIEDGNQSQLNDKRNVAYRCKGLIH